MKLTDDQIESLIMGNVGQGFTLHTNRSVLERLARDVAAACQPKWLPMESAPREVADGYIMIRGKCGVPDIVRWYPERKFRHSRGECKRLPVPEGWFRLAGERSTIYDPIGWMPLSEVSE